MTGEVVPGGMVWGVEPSERDCGLSKTHFSQGELVSYARSQYPDAPLTPQGRRRMVCCVLDRYWTIEATAERFQVDAKTVHK